MNESILKNKPSSSQFGALIANKCPSCRTGKVFTHKAYSLKFQKMNDTCPECGQDFVIEVGFYWGAMYISYGLALMVELPLMILTYHLLNDPDVWVYVGIIAVTLTLMSPLLFRISRMMMLTYFGSVKRRYLTGNKA